MVKRDKKLKVFVVGTRGFPGVTGGVEKHCEQLYPRLAKLGADVTVFTRSPYIPPSRRLKEWRGVKFINLWSVRDKYMEAIIHTFLSIIVARFHSPDIIHFHAVGPSILVPMARMLGMKVVVTNHGPDYHRQKWGKFSRKVIIQGESMSSRYATAVIVISSGIKKLIESKYGRRDLNLIPNGVTIPEVIESGETLARFGLEARRYVLAACRFVPEKGLLDLIAAYQKIKDPGFKLVLAGGADHENDCSRAVNAAARDDKRIVLPGFISGKPLEELFSHAGLFVLSSYHEGLPIALLEAMSYRLPVLVSDIPPNKEVPLPEFRYFPVGNVDMLSKRMVELFRAGISPEEAARQMKELADNYNWDAVARRTFSVYGKVMDK